MYIIDRFITHVLGNCFSYKKLKHSTFFRVPIVIDTVYINLCIEVMYRCCYVIDKWNNEKFFNNLKNFGCIFLYKHIKSFYFFNV